MNNKIILTVGTFVAGITAAGAIGIAMGKSKGIINNSGKNNKSGKSSESSESSKSNPTSVNDTGDIQKSMKEMMADVVIRESGL